MSKKAYKYSIYDYPELLCDSKLLTNRQRCITLCLFSFLDLRGGGAFNIDIIAKKTRIRKEHLYRELKKLPFIKRKGKKISLDVEKLKEFLNAKLASPASANIALKNCQNSTKKMPKQHLDSAKLAVSKCQNSTKISSESQAAQKPVGDGDNILRQYSLDKNIDKNIRGGNKEKNPPTENSEIEILEKKKDKEFIETKTEDLKKEDEKSVSNKFPPAPQDSGKPVTDAQIRASLEKIKEAFMSEYAKHFGKPPYISASPVRKMFEDFKESYKTQQRLKDITNAIIEQIPNFFNLKDDWVRKKGYSFFAFSCSIDSFLNGLQPVYATSHKDRGKYEMKEYVPW